MNNLYRFALSVFLLLVLGPSFAQIKGEQLITGDFTGLKFEDFAKQAGVRAGYKFFFDPYDLDSLFVNVKVEDRQINFVLDLIFANNDFQYVVDGQKNIFISKGIEILALHPGFFSTQVSEETQSKIQLGYLEDEKKEESRLIAESTQYDIGKKTAVIGAGNANISGTVKSSSTGEPIIGASVYIQEPLIGVSTDQFGYFTFSIPKGKHDVIVKSVGMKSTVRKIMLYDDGKLNVELDEDVTTLKEVIVESEMGSNITSMQMGLERLDIKTMKKIPVALGEVDILKVLLTLPGVQTVGEATTGLNVRGGATDQNLILFNDATIYNPSHLFGFFSAFNPDIIKNVELHKSSIPAEFGGRISSVLDVNSREGNKKKFSSTGGIGLITGRLSVEGPIVKDKASFLIAGRSTYSDWLLRKIPRDALQNSEASFYDLNSNIDYDINDRNSIYLSGYLSKDAFTLNSDTLYRYESRAATVKWKRNFTDKLYGVVTGGYSGYQYQIGSDKNPVDAFKLRYEIDQKMAKVDFNYFPRPKHTMNFGANALLYSLSPGTFLKNSDQSEIKEDELPKEQGLESAVYISDQYELSRALSIYAGLRYSHYNYLGPRDVPIYKEGESRNENAIIDTLSYSKGKSIVTYHGPEYRVSIKFSVSDQTSVKLSYNRTRQYIQMLSNTAAISPTDIWKLSDQYIKPQVGDQVSLGLYQNLRSNSIETSVEAYIKKMENSIDYKGGAKLLMNHNIETDIITANGRAYGVEMMVKKMNGKVNGWVSYTYSRSLLRTNSDFVAETINSGKFYPSNYDKPHAVNLIANYKFSHRFSTSVNVAYSTGRPITIPIAKYYVDGSYRTMYGPRNGDRIPDYFRIDFSMNIEGNHKIKKLAHGSWTVGVYNLTGRRNAYSVFFESKKTVIKGYKLSVLGSQIPTITYNFKF